MNGASEAVADAGDDALLVAVEADERREQDKEKDDQSCHDEIKNAADDAGTDDRRKIGVERFTLLVGGVHFLHVF